MERIDLRVFAAMATTGEINKRQAIKFDLLAPAKISLLNSQIDLVLYIYIELEGSRNAARLTQTQGIEDILPHWR